MLRTHAWLPGAVGPGSYQLSRIHFSYGSFTFSSRGQKLNRDRCEDGNRCADPILSVEPYPPYIP
jgi:hypothetical protein